MMARFILVTVIGVLLSCGSQNGHRESFKFIKLYIGDDQENLVFRLESGESVDHVNFSIIPAAGEESDKCSFGAHWAIEGALSEGESLITLFQTPNGMVEVVKGKNLVIGCSYEAVVTGYGLSGSVTFKNQKDRQP